MTESLVSLPEPRPEDDEDVVWGLSTASALWARGERQDAIVWLRRAAEAATAAGQDFRASELGMYASEIEDKLQQGDGDRPSSTPITEFEEVIDDDATLPIGHMAGHPLPPPAILKSKGPPGPPPPSHPSHAPQMPHAPPLGAPSQVGHPSSPGGGESRPAPVAESPSAASEARQPSRTPAAPSPSQAPMSGLLAISSPQQPAVARPGAASRHPVPSPPPSQPTAATGLRLQPRSIPPVPPPKPTSPPPAASRAPGPPASVASAEPASTASAPVQLAVSEPMIQAPPPAVESAQPAAAPARAPAGEGDGVAVAAPAHPGRKKPPRAPILDPWAEDAPPSSRAVMSAPIPIAARERAEEILLSVRSRPSSTYNEGDDVVTSAAPIEDTLRRGK